LSFLSYKPRSSVNSIAEAFTLKNNSNTNLVILSLNAIFL
jgi:hypothetical protein